LQTLIRLTHAAGRPKDLERIDDFEVQRGNRRKVTNPGPHGSSSGITIPSP